MRCEVYKDRAEEWRWRVRSANNQILADSGEGFKDQADCIHSARLVLAEDTQIETRGEDYSDVEKKS